MSKKQKQQKQLIRELEAALAQTLSDWAIERQVNRSLAEERDAAEEDVAELLRDEEASTSCIRDLRRFVAQLQEERDELRLELAGMTSDVARDAALEDVETLTQANAEADRTIGELRALVEQQRNDWSGDVEASREIIARKTEEYIKLRRDSEDTISELRDDLAKVRGQIERVSACWKRAEDLLQERERELDALRDQQAQQEHARQWDALCFRLGIAQASHIDAVIDAAQAQQEHADPVVTLQAIEELEEGERLIDDNGVIIESIPGGYEVQGAIFHAFKATPVDALQYYHEITGK